jgi:hypothetical protein
MLRHGVSPAAMADLARELGVVVVPPLPGADLKGEAWVQSHERLQAARDGVQAFRNNVGVLQDRTGRPVRYGLANDSKALNEVLKSSDLIGFKPVTITPAHVGRTLAQFWARECKRQGWVFSGTDDEQAQLRWVQLVAANGGDAAFTTGPEQA